MCSWSGRELGEEVVRVQKDVCCTAWLDDTHLLCRVFDCETNSVVMVDIGLSGEVVKSPLPVLNEGGSKPH